MAVSKIKKLSLTTASVNATFNGNSNQTSVTAPSIDGYTFVCWTSSASNGWIGATYIESPTFFTSNVWRPDTSMYNALVVCTALYQKL